MQADLPDSTSALRSRVADYCRRHGLLDGARTVLVAVSGGADSVACLDILSACFGDRVALHVAHLDHGLRDESGADAAFVEDLAASRSLPFHAGRADCGALARDEGTSIEEAARSARRRFLLETADRVGADRIATGHHLDDQAETVLIRLFRGSGTTGLAAIRPIADDRWIRPLLSVTRAEIDAYVGDSALAWRTDPTNVDESILRNRIRHRLMPLVKSEFADRVPEALARAADILREDDDCLDAITLDASKTVICARSSRKFALDGPRFFGYHVAVQRRLIRALLGQAGLSPRRIEHALIDRVLTRLREGPGSIQVSPDLTACRAGRLILLGAAAPPFEERVRSGLNRIASIDASMSVDDVPKPGFPARFDKTTPYEIWFDRGRLPQGMVLRQVRPGDRIRAFGGPGTASVSDLLIDRKVPRLVRDEVPVLADGSEVHWVVGIRAGERSRVTASSEHAVRFRFDGSWRQFYSAVQHHT